MCDRYKCTQLNNLLAHTKCRSKATLRPESKRNMVKINIIVMKLVRPPISRGAKTKMTTCRWPKACAATEHGIPTPKSAKKGSTVGKRDQVQSGIRTTNQQIERNARDNPEWKNPAKRKGCCFCLGALRALFEPLCMNSLGSSLL